MTEEEFDALKVGSRVRLLPSVKKGGIFREPYEGTVVRPSRKGAKGLHVVVLMDKPHTTFHDCRGHTPESKGYNLWDKELDRWESITLKTQIQTLWEGALL